METASQNSALLLTNLLSLQGAGLSVPASSQSIETTGKEGAEPFSTSLQESLKSLLANVPQGGAELDAESLTLVMEQLLGGNAAMPGGGLPLTEGQEFAANLTQEQLAELVAQLETLGISVPEERLAALVQGGGEPQAGQSKQPPGAVVSVLAQIKSASSFGSVVSAQMSDQAATHVEASDNIAVTLDEKRLMEKLNTVLPRQTSQNPVFKEPPSLAASAELDADNVINQLSSSQPVRPAVAQPVTPIPVLLERFASLNPEKQAANDMTDLLSGKSLEAGVLQQQPLGRTISSMTPAAEARPLQSFIQTPLTDAQWQTDFSNRVVMMTKGLGQGQVQVAEIRLNPQHMGPIEVRVVMNDDQASVSFMAQNGVVREAIETSLPRLREMFSGSGLLLADADVSEQSLHQRHADGQAGSEQQAGSQSDAGFSADDPGVQVLGQLDLSTIEAASLSGLDLYA